MKLFSSLFGGLALLVFAAYVGMKMVVGSVNFPVGSTTVDTGRMAGQIALPPGFVYSIFADDVPNARELLLSDTGDLLVANPNRDQVVLLKRDENADGEHDGKMLLLDQLNGPNGMDFYHSGAQSWLYIAEQDAIGRIAYDHQRGQVLGEYKRLVSGLPGGGNHWKKGLRVGPDNKLYVMIGSSCNVCLEKDRRRATLVRYELDGSGEHIVARGLRNSEGYDWSPRDGALYATDNGRDLLGDDFPPCELNKIVEGAHYGWPFVNGDNSKDPDYGDHERGRGLAFVSPVHGFRAHNAPLGIAFLKNRIWPADYRHAALVALHGSWNRSEKDGYKVVSLHWQDDGSVEERDFMSGFLKQDKTIGRPAEIVEADDGSIYISDDYAGAVYRIRYQPE